MTPDTQDREAVAFIRGVESPLPPGERVLWQGAPEWRSLARYAFHARTISIYFAVLIVLSGALTLQGETPLHDFGVAAFWLTASAVASVAFASVFAVLTMRSTTYAITTRRVVLRVGIALPVVLNIPLRIIDSVAIARRSKGTGDIALHLEGDVRVAYLVLWPHARAWRLRHPEPLLRSIANPDQVGEILASALRQQAVAAGDIMRDASAHSAEHAA